MATKPIKKSVLFRTSAASDVQYAGGKLTILGLNGPINRKDIINVSQIKYRAEVAQVMTVGATTYTPASSTKYSVVVYDPLRSSNSYTEAQVTYSFTTPADVTTLGNAAAQREAIHAGIIAKINAASSFNHATAVSLGGGTGFTITDAGSYYPVSAQGMANTKGANTVYTITTGIGTGFADNYTTTTAAVYSFGDGTKLAAEKPVVDFVYGNVVSGVIEDAPLTSANPGLPAVAGQKYDGFFIECYEIVDGVTLGGQYVYQLRNARVFVDNGTGTSTANLAGFIAFERAFLNAIFSQFATDPATVITMGDTSAISQGLATGLPSGVAQAENVISFGNGFTLHYSPIATSTLLAPISTTLGLGLILDATASEGIELSGPTWASSQKSFIIGKTAFSIYAKVNIDDVSGLNPFWVGFRKKEAYQATFTAYTDYAVIGLGNATGDIYTNTEKNGAGNTATDTTDNWADLATKTLEVRVDINGAVTFFINGYKPTVTQAFSFDAGDEVIFTAYALQTADIGTPSLLELAVVPSDSWRS